MTRSLTQLSPKPHMTSASSQPHPHVRRSDASHPAHSLLSRAHSPSTAEQIFTEKVRQKPLLLLPSTTQSSSTSDSRTARRLARLRKKEYFLRKQKPRPLSAKRKRILGVHDLKKDECKYAIFEGLHRLWVGYMQEVLGLTTTTTTRRRITAQGHGSLLASADYHGAEVEVVRSGCVDRVGLSGIVVRDTKFTFVLVTRKDEVKTIPKEDTIFRFEIPPIPKTKVLNDADLPVPAEKNLTFELHGNQFEHRPADRATKKFKWKRMDFF